MDTKALFAVLLVAGLLGGFSINEYLIEEENGNLFSENDPEEPIEQVVVGGEAPDFTLTDTNGTEFNLSDYEGEKVLVLEFTSMKCGTCKSFEKNEIKSYCNDSMPEDVESEQTLVFLNGPEFGAVYTALLPEIHNEVGPKRVILLSGVPEVTLKRTGTNSLDLHIPNGWFYRGVLVFKPTKSFEVGEKIDRGHYSAEVLEVTSQGDPSLVRFQLEKNLNRFQNNFYDNFFNPTVFNPPFTKSTTCGIN